MKKLLFILAFVPFLLSGQTPDPLVDLSEYHDDSRIKEMTDLNFTNITEGVYEFSTLNISGDVNITDGNLNVDGIITPSEVVHAFIYFGDSAVSISYTTAWAHFTNATDSIFIQYELDGFTISGDTITIENTGDYIFQSAFSYDGDNAETTSMRFFNVTQTAGIPVGNPLTGRGANNFGSNTILGYGKITAGDEVVVQFKGDGNGTSVFKNGAILIEQLHD